MAKRSPRDGSAGEEALTSRIAPRRRSVEPPLPEHRARSLLVAIAAVLAALGGSFAYTGWGESADTPPLEPSPSSSPERRLEQLLADAGTRPSIDTRPAESALAPLRAQLSLPPRVWPAAHLAFAGDRIVRRVAEGIEVVELSDRSRHVFPTGQVRALFDMGASLGAVAASQVLLFDPGKKAPRRLPGVTWLPGAQVFPDLVTRSHLLVLHPASAAIYRYQLDDGLGALLALDSHHELPEFDGNVFVALRDGSFVYSAGASLVRLYTSGHTKKLTFPKRETAPLRALRARRIDQIFMLYADGSIERLQLQDRVRVAWSTRLQEAPFDLTAAHDDLVALEQVQGEKRTWQLRVWGPERDEPLIIPLGESEATGDDWAERLHQTMGLAVSRGRVAVAGPLGLSVWKLDSGERLLAPP